MITHKMKTWKAWKESTPDPSVSYWDCDPATERLTHEELEEAVLALVEDTFGMEDPELLKESVKAEWPSGLSVCGFKRLEVTSKWLETESEYLAERFTEDFEETFGGTDYGCINDELADELTEGIKKFLESVRPKLVPWACEQVIEVTLTLDEVLEVMRVKP